MIDHPERPPSKEANYGRIFGFLMVSTTSHSKMAGNRPPSPKPRPALRGGVFRREAQSDHPPLSRCKIERLPCLKNRAKKWQVGWGLILCLFVNPFLGRSNIRPQQATRRPTSRFTVREVHGCHPAHRVGTKGLTTRNRGFHSIGLLFSEAGRASGSQ